MLSQQTKRSMRSIFARGTPGTLLNMLIINYLDINQELNRCK
jgi:hypothetical protein